MEYNVFSDTVDLNIINFLNEYHNAGVIFRNDDVKNGLLHPGEYGMYKERLVEKLFRFALTNRYSYGTGFVINEEKEITTQCDIVVYDESNTPFCSFEQSRFFHKNQYMLLAR